MGFKIVGVHFLYAGRIGEVEYGHTVVLGLAVTIGLFGMGIGQDCTLRSVKYLNFVYDHSCVLFEET